MGTAARLVAHGVLIGLLTALTQLGGLAYLTALLVTRRIGRARHAVSAAVAFVAVYGALSLAAAWVAPLAGRTALPCFATTDAKLAMQSPLYCVLNRHYVRPSMRRAAERLAAHLDAEFPGTLTLALDGGFPFVDGFPLLPHLSHDDGAKLDLALYYRDADGDYARGRTRSPIGYWAFERPTPPARDTCAGSVGGPSLRWEMRWLEPLLRRGYALDEERTREALTWLAGDGPRSGVSRVFVEPHLRERLGVSGAVLRFQGCRAARHDDHIHVEVGG